MEEGRSMEFRTLQYFLAVAQEENLSKAAEVLHITQPTLSRQMQSLEEELNAQLFIRGKNFSLTNAGLLLKERAEEMISLSEKTKSEFEQVNQMIGGTISIGSAAIGNKSILTDLMAEFRSQFPKVSFELTTGTGPEITEGINKGLLDVGLLIEPLPYEKYAYKKLSHVEKWGVIMHKDSPLADKEQITAEDLKEMTVAYSFRKDTQKLLSNHLKIDVTELDTFGTFNLISNAIGLPENNQAYLLSIVSVINEAETDQVTYRLFEPKMTSGLAFIWKKNKVFSDATRNFIHFIQDKEL